jgi:hypothetical protein
MKEARSARATREARLRFSFHVSGSPLTSFTASAGYTDSATYAPPCTAWQSSQWQYIWTIGAAEILLRGRHDEEGSGMRDERR